MIDFSHTAAIILAAGRGTRIGSPLPKVLCPIAGKPMISYIIRTLKELGIKDVYVVTGYRSADVQASVGSNARFVYQSEQLGTGHAFHAALREIPVYIDTVLVVNGDDSAFYERKTLSHLLDSHSHSKTVMTLLTAIVKNPSALGRIVRDKSNQIVAIREEKSASKPEKLIKEVNIGCYVFDVDWAERILPTITKSPAGEYYIGDTVQCAFSEGHTVNSEPLSDLKEWIGVNTQEQLEIANQAMYDDLIKRNKPTVFIVDNDNTLLNTVALKAEINTRIEAINSIMPVGKHKVDIKKFWSTYEDLKEKSGWVSYHELASLTSEEVGMPELVGALKHMFYTLRFDKYVFRDTRETLGYLGKLGKVVIFGDGDLIYVPVKIRGMKIENYINDIFVFEKKDNHIEKISKIYGDYKQVIIDDQIRILEQFKQYNKSAVCIWISNGPYSKVTPRSRSFRPDYQIGNIHEVENIVREWI